MAINRMQKGQVDVMNALKIKLPAEYPYLYETHLHTSQGRRRIYGDYRN